MQTKKTNRGRIQETKVFFHKPVGGNIGTMGQQMKHSEYPAINRSVQQRIIQNVNKSESNR